MKDSMKHLIERLKRYPRVFRMAHGIGIALLRIPVLLSGAFRHMGFCVNQNSRKLRKYRNLYQGKRCVLVVNGPSLRAEDLDKIKDEVTFGCNKIFYLYDQTAWRPDYYAILDERYIELYQDEIFEQIRAVTFTNKQIYKKIRQEQKEKRSILYTVQINYSRFRAWPHLLAYTYGTNQGSVLSYMVAVAMYMGFSEIYLLGADNTASAAGNHFPGYREDERLNEINRKRMEENQWDAGHWQNEMELEMDCFRKYADKHGIKIWNATRGGRLEVFERIDFDKVWR